MAEKNGGNRGVEESVETVIESNTHNRTTGEFTCSPEAVGMVNDCHIGNKATGGNRFAKESVEMVNKSNTNNRAKTREFTCSLEAVGMVNDCNNGNIATGGNRYFEELVEMVNTSYTNDRASEKFTCSPEAVGMVYDCNIGNIATGGKRCAEESVEMVNRSNTNIRATGEFTCCPDAVGIDNDCKIYNVSPVGNRGIHVAVDMFHHSNMFNGAHGVNSLAQVAADRAHYCRNDNGSHTFKSYEKGIVQMIDGSNAHDGASMCKCEKRAVDMVHGNKTVGGNRKSEANNCSNEDVVINHDCVTESELSGSDACEKGQINIVHDCNSYTGATGGATSEHGDIGTDHEWNCDSAIPAAICEKGAVGMVNGNTNHNRAAIDNNIEQGAGGMEHDRKTDNITPGCDTLEQIAFGTEHGFNNGNITPRGDKSENRGAEMVHDCNTNRTPGNYEEQPGGITHDKGTVDHYSNAHSEPVVAAAQIVQDSTNDVQLHGGNTCGEINHVTNANTLSANECPENITVVIIHLIYIGIISALNYNRVMGILQRNTAQANNSLGRQCEFSSHDGSTDHHTDQHGDVIVDSKNLQKRSNRQTGDKSAGNKCLTSSSVRKKSHKGDAKTLSSKYSVNSDTNKNKSNTNVSTCRSTTLTEGNVTPPGETTRSDGVESSTISANIAEGEEATINRTEGSSNETGACAEDFCQTPRQNSSWGSNANTRDDDRVGGDNVQSADNNYHHTDEMVVSLNNPGTVDLNPYSQPIGVYYEIDMHFANRLFPCDNEATEPRPHLDMPRADGSLPNNDAQEPDGSLPNNDDEDNTYYDNQDNEDY